MKKFAILFFSLLSVITVLVTSCKKEEPEIVEEVVEPFDYRDSIVGNYQMHRVRHQSENGDVSHFEDDFNSTVTHGYHSQTIRIFQPNAPYREYEFLQDSTIVYLCANSWSSDTTYYPVGTWTGDSLEIFDDLTLCQNAPAGIVDYISFSGVKL